MKKPMKIRAHHLLCIPRFYGGGYTKEFGSNLKEICMKIRHNPAANIKVIIECDDICEKCLYKKDDVCKKTPKLNEWILRKDTAVLDKLKIKQNSIHKAKDLFNYAMNTVASKNVAEICKGCVFLRNCLKVGINNAFRKELNKN